MKKLAFWGSIASILGVLIAFFPHKSVSENRVEGNTSSYGNQSPAIGQNNGSIYFNYGLSESGKQKGHVLRHPGGGSVLVVSVPDIQAAMDSSRHVCMAMPGTPVRLIGESAKHAGISMWQKVAITSGPCSSSEGWTAVGNISFE